MTVKERTQLEGNFDWRLPTIVPSFIEGDDAEAFLAEFNERTDTDYEGSPTLKVLTYDDGIVKGSNPFAVVLANQILRPVGIRTATPADLGRVVDSDGLPLRHQYEDAALVLRSVRDSYDPNEPLAQDLDTQLKARGIEASPETPIMIPLTGFDLANAENQYGLSFQLRDDAHIIEAPELSNKNSGKKFSQTDDRGLPIFDSDGNRTLYTRNEGLSGLILDGDLGVGSSWNRLGDYDSGGRVVLIGGEAGAPDFSAKLRTSVEQAQSELAGRYEQANAIMNAAYEEANSVLRGK